MAKKNVPYDQEYYDKEIETMPREQLEELQLGYLKDELKFAYDNCPYYKRAWDEAGVSPKSRPSPTCKSSPSSTSRPNATPRVSAASSASCAVCPKTTSSTWRPHRDRPAFPR